MEAATLAPRPPRDPPVGTKSLAQLPPLSVELAGVPRRPTYLLERVGGGVSPGIGGVGLVGGFRLGGTASTGEALEGGPCGAVLGGNCGSPTSGPSGSVIVHHGLPSSLAVLGGARNATRLSAFLADWLFTARNAEGTSRGPGVAKGTALLTPAVGSGGHCSGPEVIVSREGVATSNGAAVTKGLAASTVRKNAPTLPQRTNSQQPPGPRWVP